MLNNYFSHFESWLHTTYIIHHSTVKIYIESTYRQITDLLELSDKIQTYLHLKRFHITQNSRNSFKNFQSSFNPDNSSKPFALSMFQSHYRSDFNTIHEMNGVLRGLISIPL